MDVITLLLIYFAAMNLIGFALMGIDKYKAKKRAFRIPEATLFIVALIGGSIGSILGMDAFRHKTKHWYFQVVNIFSLAIHIAIGIYLLNL